MGDGQDFSGDGAPQFSSRNALPLSGHQTRPLSGTCAQDEDDFQSFSGNLPPPPPPLQRVFQVLPAIRGSHRAGVRLQRRRIRNVRQVRAARAPFRHAAPRDLCAGMGVTSNGATGTIQLPLLKCECLCPPPPPAHDSMQLFILGVPEPRNVAHQFPDLTNLPLRYPSNATLTTQETKLLP